ncbi:PsbP-related protein [Methanobrevibacter filiformis]|uniref:PsbP C-terminal domain-containing protein n=1 Tax=Methanobrevibacter filiformis TaxID=55758 RepID=A0A165Z582_9EURY|nr:PsbP-related protein [Methanobrevibacter filiformis]KZX10262.1 hypothetical protein MBFIL_18360 [Methanobrevibacter filiformis]
MKTRNILVVIIIIAVAFGGYLLYDSNYNTSYTNSYNGELISFNYPSSWYEVQNNSTVVEIHKPESTDYFKVANRKDNMSLDDYVSIAINNTKNYEAYKSMSEPKKTTIDGVESYIIDYKLGANHTVIYSKKGNLIFNLDFMYGDPEKAKNIIDNVLNSFKFK